MKQVVFLTAEMFKFNYSVFCIPLLSYISQPYCALRILKYAMRSSAGNLIPYTKQLSYLPSSVLSRLFLLSLARNMNSRSASWMYCYQTLEMSCKAIALFNMECSNLCDVVSTSSKQPLLIRLEFNQYFLPMGSKKTVQRNFESGLKLSLS